MMQQQCTERSGIEKQKSQEWNDEGLIVRSSHGIGTVVNRQIRLATQRIHHLPIRPGRPSRVAAVLADRRMDLIP
jgi:hypothetical protein